MFGLFAAERAEAGGGGAGLDSTLDFVFYDLETAPWDMVALRAYVQALRSGAPGGPATLLRIPPVARDRAAARRRIAEAIAAGADGLILPQVESPEEVGLAVEALREAGRTVWRSDPRGDTVVVVQIESRAAVEAASDILAAEGAGVGLPGQKDLRASYRGDERAVQGAVVQVLAACDALGLPCGVTAGPHDVTGRLEQGFRFVIATPPEALIVGRDWKGAGRREA